jgi:hypothetical protein
MAGVQRLVVSVGEALGLVFLPILVAVVLVVQVFACWWMSVNN